MTAEVNTPKNENFGRQSDANDHINPNIPTKENNPTKNQPPDIPHQNKSPTVSIPKIVPTSMCQSPDDTKQTPKPARIARTDSSIRPIVELMPDKNASTGSTLAVIKIGVAPAVQWSARQLSVEVSEAGGLLSY